MKFTINKEYSKATIKAPRNSGKTCSKLTKTSKRHDKHCCGILVVKSGHVPHQLQCFCIYVQRKFVFRADIQLIFKNVGRNKKVYAKCKSEKITEADLAPRYRSYNIASC